MDHRDILKSIVAVAVATVVVAAVLAAGYILVTSLVGGPGPSPTSTAAPYHTPTPNPSIPSGPFNPTGTSSYPVVPTPVQGAGVKSAELTDYGTDKDMYNRGDTASAYIIIKNTGTVPIDEAQLKVNVEKYFSYIGYTNVASQTVHLTDLGIQPGETKRNNYNFTIPSDYQGISTAGKYQFTTDVYVWDTKIGSFKKEVEVK